MIAQSRSQVTSKTHPTLSAAERRAERARLEGSSYQIIHSQVTLRRKSDGKTGRIRFALVSRPGQETPYTVRLRPNGDACRCSCRSHEIERERRPHAPDACKHILLVNAAGGLDQQPAPVPPCEEPLPVAIQQWAAERLEQAAQDNTRLWEDHPTF